ncbi:hypothetical protein C8R47DRAFT_1084947 [Mycena vitilis]|nr:hypothetical protein C8R47DRAFT_1084947 [Mycena vitilis]
MSSPYYCSLPLHGLSRNLTSKVYLVTSPLLAADCTPTGRPPSGCPKAWAVAGPFNITTTTSPSPHGAIVVMQPAPVPRYAISGTGIVYTDLNNALEQFERVAASRPATFLTTEDSCYAARFAAGHSEMEARALADGPRILQGSLTLDTAKLAPHGSSSTQAHPEPWAAKKVKSAATVHASDDEDEDEARENTMAPTDHCSLAVPLPLVFGKISHTYVQTLKRTSTYCWTPTSALLVPSMSLLPESNTLVGLIFSFCKVPPQAVDAVET